MLGASVYVLATPRQAATPPPTAQALLREAERAVPAPALPPAPPNALIERQEALIGRSIRVPAPAGIAPRLEAPQVVQQRVLRPTISGVSPQDAAAWQAEVERRQAAHDQAIEAALKRLEDQAKADEAAKASQGGGLVSGTVAILGAVAGLLGAVATLVTALRGKPA